MKVIECRGSRRHIGECAGEELREEINLHVENFLENDLSKYRKSIALFKSSIKRHLPHMMDEIKGIAGGADVSVEKILALNLPGGQAIVDEDLYECSNIVFGGGPDGPLWGKNNDGKLPERPACALKIYPAEGIPVINFTFCGFLAAGDMMNYEGVAAGHSSVGSKFNQNPNNVSARLWMYEGMFRAKTTMEYAEHLTSLPLFGKGFSQAVVDSEGNMLSAEIACPLVQLRRPEPGEKSLNCVNSFQLPLLKNCTNRKPEKLENAYGRQAYFERASNEGDTGLGHMKQILRHHGEYSICRHGEKDLSNTTFSMIGMPSRGKALFRFGHACGGEYAETTL